MQACRSQLNISFRTHCRRYRSEPSHKSQPPCLLNRHLYKEPNPSILLNMDLPVFLHLCRCIRHQKGSHHQSDSFCVLYHTCLSKQHVNSIFARCAPLCRGFLSVSGETDNGRRQSVSSEPLHTPALLDHAEMLAGFEPLVFGHLHYTT